MHKTSRIYLSKSSVESNRKFIKSLLNPDVILSAVVKGNAYGHGIEEYIPLAESCGYNHFSVFSASEAYRVRKASKANSPIMIMGDIHLEDIEWVVDNEVEFFVFEIDRVEEAIEAAKKIGKPARIHVELETGFNRTGFNKEGLIQLVELIFKHKDHLSVEGICTHFAGAESIANHVRVKKQIKLFNKYYKFLLKQGVEPKLKHAACSAATVAYPKTQMDMVRVGILQFGFWPSKEVLITYLAKNKERENGIDPLKRVISWESQVMSVKAVETGEFIGYGTSFLAQQAMKVATIPVGYAHGYSRALSNQGRAIINGKRVGVVGTINMNMMMLDVTEVPDVTVGNRVTLIGGDNGIDISVASFGELSNQLNYELLTRLPHNIPRYLVD